MGPLLESDSIRGCSAVVHGLRFYTPDVYNESAKTACERWETDGGLIGIDEVLAREDGVYVLTPSGEHALADLDVSGLEQVERDLKRINSDGNREQ